MIVFKALRTFGPRWRGTKRLRSLAYSRCNLAVTLFSVMLFLATVGAASPTAIAQEWIDAVGTNGQTVSAANAPLASAIEAAAESLDPDRIPDPDQTAEQTVAAIDEATRWLRTNTSGENFQAWLEFLQFDPLLDAIDEEKSAGVIGREAVALRYRLVGIDPGLELSVLRTVREQLKTLIASLRFRNRDRAVEGIAKSMRDTAESLREDDGVLEVATREEIAEMIDLLSQSNQAPGLIERVRSEFSTRNAVVSVHESLITDAAARAVNECRGVNDCILGTRVIGTAQINGAVTADVRPAEGAVELALFLNGTYQGRNRGYNGPVTLQTAGRGQVFASRVATISFDGVALSPTYAKAVLDNDILSITPKKRFGRRIVKKIASKRAAEQKPAADRIAVDKLRTQVGTQFDSQTSEAIAFTPPKLMDRVVPVLRRLDLETPPRQLRSTDSRIIVDTVISSDDQLSTRVARPGFPQHLDIAVQLHESVVDNAAAKVLAGRTLTRTELLRWLKLGGVDTDALAERVAEAGESGEEDANDNDANKTDDDDRDDDDAAEDAEDFEIDFARDRPIIFEARDGGVRVGIRGTRFAQGSRELKRSLEIVANYVPGMLPDGRFVLVRQGEGKVEFPGRSRRLSIAQAGLRRTLEKRFATAFPEILLDRTFTVPSTVSLETLAGRTFRIEHIAANNGWFTVAAQ